MYLSVLQLASPPVYIQLSLNFTCIASREAIIGHACWPTWWKLGTKEQYPYKKRLNKYESGVGVKG